MKPWERRPREPPRAHALFDQFLALGPYRSLRQLDEIGVASYDYLKKLSAKWRWQERAAAWQAEVARAQHSARTADIRQVRDRQLRDARTLRMLARVQMRKWVEQRRGARDPHPGFSGHVVARMWQTGYQAEDLLLPEVETEKEQRPRERRLSEDPRAQRPPSESELIWDQAMDVLTERARQAGVPEEGLPTVRARVQAVLQQYLEVAIALGHGEDEAAEGGEV